MATRIEDIVQVQITRETARITRVGFGTPLILAEVSNVSDRVKTYNEPSELLDDNYSTSSNVYIAAVKLYSQELSPSQFKVGRKLADVNDLQTTTFDAVATAGTYTITVGTQTTAGIAFDAATSVVETAIEALTNVTSVTVVGTLDANTTQTIEFDGADANTEFPTVSYNVSSLTGTTTATTVHTQWGSADETWTTAINAVDAADTDWYCLLAETRTASEILELSAVIETKLKIYIACSDDADVLTSSTTDIASSLQDLSYDRTAYIWSDDEANFPEAAWAGGLLPYDPGSITWKFKTLVGITPSVLSSTELTYLKAKYANFFETVAGQNIITSDAVVASNEYIDIIRGTDWIQQRMTEDIFEILVNSQKVPYTDRGIESITTAVRNRLKIAAEAPYNIIIADSITVDAPLRENVSSSDLANRILDNVTFSALYQGAIHKVEIAGKLSL